MRFLLLDGLQRPLVQWFVCLPLTRPLLWRVEDGVRMDVDMPPHPSSTLAADWSGFVGGGVGCRHVRVCR